MTAVSPVVSEPALYLPLALVPGFDPRLSVGIAVLAVLSEMTGVLGPTIGASRRYDGPMGKSDRAFVLGLLALLLGLGVSSGAWLVVAQGGVLTLLLVTVWNRAAHALREEGP